MGSIPLDNGESVYIHDGTGSADPVAISALEGSSVANLMKNRERFDYTWADAAERAAQTGMIQGSRGYQEDSKSEYIYDNSAWRLGLAYAEYTSVTTGVANSVVTSLGSFTLDASASTDSTMATPGGTGVIRIANPGIYSISSLCALKVGAGANDPATSRTFIDVALSGSIDPLQRMSCQTGEDRVSLSLPTYRVAVANTDLLFQIFKNTSGSAGTYVDTRVRIGRLA